ncbi:hypothetical protein FA13DRAFT_1274130 [Coprinellus micaceus]|uniref:Uncharacterized protein n=1 Tax=Coprinellus micaceus TaxID=71717 RepID=A0A4Y7R8W6_COPMI|nr:hypothetical protein FA13DRAFT_1274130 [Coprinellus micaceus]
MRSEPAGRNPTTVLQFSLPWAQLHEFNASAQCDTSYHDIIQAEPLELRQLEYFASTTNSLYDSNPLTLPTLTKLLFRTYELNSELDILAHLDLLTLPALAHLEIRGLSSPTMNRLYDRVLSLVTRSKCSLQCLCIHASEGFTSGQWTPCSKLLALCPELTHLLLASPEGDLLNTLIYDPSSPSPMLPKLKVFIVRNSDIDGVSRVLDASALMKVIKSRTEGLPEGTQQALEEVTFIWDDAEMLQLQISFMELADTQSEESSAFNIARTATEELAARARLRLDSQFNRWWHRRRAYFNPRLHLEMNKFLSQLEDLDLEKHDTRPFMRRGIPYLLRSTSNRSAGRIPGDRVFRFRSRASKLCEKWKPYLLRDAEPYYWCFYGEATASMRWKPSDCSEDTSETEDISKESRLWKDISGKTEPSGQTLSWF